MSLSKSALGAKLALSAALLALATAPYGCSKGGEQAPKQEAQQQQAAPAADPAKEHFEKGVQYSLKGQYDEAIKEYEATLQINPKSSETYNNLGFAYMDKGVMDKAIDAQKKAIEINPQMANAYFGLAMAQEKKGDKAEALKNWKEFAKLSQPHSKWWMKAQEHIAALEGKGGKAPKK